MITDLPKKRMRKHSDKHFLEFYLQDGGKKSTGIDMEQNYVTVTLQYTEGEMMSQNIWPRYDRHFVGITWHNVRS